MRGRKPIPTAMKRLTGNAGKRPLNEHEPVPKGDLYAAPEWMSARQREGWGWAVTNAPSGLLKLLDRSVLAVWVIAEDLHREASEKIQQYGLLTKSPNAGLPLQSPYLAIVNKQAQIMLKAAAELGFSPSSRSRVQIMPEGAHAFDRHGVRALRALAEIDDPDDLIAKPWNLGKDPTEKFFVD